MSNKNKFNGNTNKPFVPEKKKDDKKARNVAIVLLLVLAFCCFGSVLAVGLTVKDCTTASAEEIVSEEVPVPEGYPNLIQGDFTSNVTKISDNTFSVTFPDSYVLTSFSGKPAAIANFYPSVSLLGSYFTFFISASYSPGSSYGFNLTYFGYFLSPGLSSVDLSTADTSSTLRVVFLFDKAEDFKGFTSVVSVGVWKGNFSNTDFASSVYYQAGLLQGQTDGYKLGYNEGYSKGQQDTVINFDPNSMFSPFVYEKLSSQYKLFYEFDDGSSSGSSTPIKNGFTVNDNIISFSRGQLPWSSSVANTTTYNRLITVGFTDFVPVYNGTFLVHGIDFLSTYFKKYFPNENSFDPFLFDLRISLYTSPLYSGSDPDPYFNINYSSASYVNASFLPDGSIYFPYDTVFPLKCYGFSIQSMYFVNTPDSEGVYHTSTYSLTASEFFGISVEFAGYSNNYSEGYKDGYSVGSSTGYNAGYSKGVENAGKYTFLSLLGAVVDAPLQAVSGMLNFNLLGFNMLNFFYALLTCALVIAVIRLIL